LHVYQGCGHLPHIEHSGLFNEQSVRFLLACAEERANARTRRIERVV
jgi:hypothetical protein